MSRAYCDDEVRHSARDRRRLERAESPRSAVATRPREAGWSVMRNKRKGLGAMAGQAPRAALSRTTVVAGDRPSRAVQPSRRGCMALHRPVCMHEAALHRRVCMHEVVPSPGAPPLACTAGSSPVESSPVESSPVESSPVETSPVLSTQVGRGAALCGPTVSRPAKRPSESRLALRLALPRRGRAARWLGRKHRRCRAL